MKCAVNPTILAALGVLTMLSGSIVCAKTPEFIPNTTTELSPSRVVEPVGGYWVNGTWKELTPTRSIAAFMVQTVGDSTSVYTSSGYEKSSSMFIPCYFRNGIRVDLKPPIDTKDGLVTCLANDNGDIYAGGVSFEREVDDIYTPGYWKNGVWVGLALGHGLKSGFTNSITVSGQDVYVGGHLIKGPFQHIPGYWKNGVWVDLTPANNYGWVEQIILSGSDVYAQVANCNGYWKNGIFTDAKQLGQGAVIYSIAVSGDDFYATGEKQQLPGYWKNGAWVGLPLFDGDKSGCVRAITVDDDDVYCAGTTYSFTNNKSHYTPAFWKNGVGNKLSENNAAEYWIKSIAVNSDDVYIAGDCYREVPPPKK